MNNPIDDIKVKPEADLTEVGEKHRQQLAKKEEIYAKFGPMVNEILEQFIAAHRPGLWEMDSDCTRSYCCHVAWFAGPKEKYSDPYDPHHTLRHRLEIKLEMDGLCNPTGFAVINYEAIDKIVHVGLEREDILRGIQAVMA